METMKIIRSKISSEIIKYTDDYIEDKYTGKVFKITTRGNNGAYYEEIKDAYVEIIIKPLEYNATLCYSGCANTVIYQIIEWAKNMIYWYKIERIFNVSEEIYGKIKALEEMIEVFSKEVEKYGK